MGEMLPGPTSDWSEVYSLLLSAFQTRYPSGPGERLRMVGLLFAPIGSTLVNDEILSRLNYYNYRSSNNIDFFCSGYLSQVSLDAQPKGAFPDARQACRIGESTWYFSDQKFNDYRRELESRSTWKYSGDVDLLLVNAIFTPFNPRHPKVWGVKLDFAKAIAVNIAQAKHDGAILSVASFFEDIFRYADHQTGDDPTWGFSETMEVRQGGSAFVELILLAVPPPIRNLWRRGRHFTILNPLVKSIP